MNSRTKAIEVVEELEDRGFKVSLTTEGKVRVAGQPPSVANTVQLAGVKQHKDEIVQVLTELQQWYLRIDSALSKEEVFALLADFRPLPWTNHQRAAMSQRYIAQLEKLKRSAPAQ